MQNSLYTLAGHLTLKKIKVDSKNTITIYYDTKHFKQSNVQIKVVET